MSGPIKQQSERGPVTSAPAPKKRRPLAKLEKDYEAAKTRLVSAVNGLRGAEPKDYHDAVAYKRTQKKYLSDSLDLLVECDNKIKQSLVLKEKNYRAQLVGLTAELNKKADALCGIYTVNLQQPIIPLHLTQVSQNLLPSSNYTKSREVVSVRNETKSGSGSRSSDIAVTSPVLSQTQPPRPQRKQRLDTKGEGNNKENIPPLQNSQQQQLEKRPSVAKPQPTNPTVISPAVAVVQASPVQQQLSSSGGVPRNAPANKQAPSYPKWMPDGSRELGNGPNEPLSHPDRFSTLAGPLQKNSQDPNLSLLQIMANIFCWPFKMAMLFVDSLISLGSNQTESNSPSPKSFTK